jgi:hypothetical protein
MKDILDYFQKNPDALDTLEGIATWWLLNRYPTQEVQAALCELVAAGLVVERRGRNKQTYYRRGGAAV